MSVKMKFGSKDIPFVYKGNKLVYPNPIKDGLLLWYDFKGMRNTDTNKEVAKDLSLNGNDGTLTNFNFTEESGYKDNTLVFDGVDDKLTVPELVLDETAMSVMHDGKVYVYEDDKVVTVGEDGEIVGEKINLLSSTSHTMKKTLNMGWGSNYGSFIAEPLETYTVKVYIKPIDNSASVQIVFRGSNGSNIRESGVGNWISPGEEGYVTRTYQAPEGTASAWIQIRNVKRLNSGAMLEYKELQVFEGSHSKFYSSNPKDYKTTTLTPSSLTDLQLYNKTLRKDELLHNAESKGLKQLKPGVIVQDGLVLHYDFSHESNTSEYKGKAFDYSGNGNHGVLNNFNFTEESGYDGNKLKFDGVDDEIAVTGLTRNSSFSIFFSAGHILDENVLFFNFSNSNTYLQLTNSEARSRLYFFAQSNDGTSNYYGGVYSSDLPYKANELVFMGVVVIKDLVILYADGIEVGRGNLRAEILPIALSSIGKWNNSYTAQNFNSVYYYNRPLTPEEIAHNHTIEKDKYNII